MKSVTQTLILIGALLGVIFAITFVSQWVSPGSRPEQPDTPPTENAKALKLNFPQVAQDANLLVEMHPMTGSFDFWFRNANAQPVEIGVHSRSCKCARVEVCTLTTAEESEYQAGGRYAASQVLAAPAGTLALLATTAAITERVRSFYFPSDRWQVLADHAGSHPPALIPAGSTGFVRVGWDGKDEKGQRLKATMLMNAKGDDARAIVHLEVPVDFVPAVKVSQTFLNLTSPLLEGQKTSISFVCWSSTRSGFVMKAAEKTGDSCFQCAWAPISEEECRREAGLDDKVTVRSAYRVTITVNTEGNGKKLEMGPFNRTIELTCDAIPGWAAEITVRGTVMGNIRLASTERKDVVDLGDFPAAKGTSTQVTLEADPPIVNLAVESQSPPYLAIKLDELQPTSDGKKQWTLSVKVPADRAEGRLPRGSGVVLKTKDSSSRRIRIPIIGHATN